MHASEGVPAAHAHQSEKNRPSGLTERNRRHRPSIFRRCEDRRRLCRARRGRRCVQARYNQQIRRFEEFAGYRCSALSLGGPSCRSPSRRGRELSQPRDIGRRSDDGIVVLTSASTRSSPSSKSARRSALLTGLALVLGAACSLSLALVLGVAGSLGLALVLGVAGSPGLALLLDVACTPAACCCDRSPPFRSRSPFSPPTLLPSRSPFSPPSRLRLRSSVWLFAPSKTLTFLDPPFFVKSRALSVRSLQSLQQGPVRPPWSQTGVKLLARMSQNKQ